MVSPLDQTCRFPNWNKHVSKFPMLQIRTDLHRLRRHRPPPHRRQSRALRWVPW